MSSEIIFFRKKNKYYLIAFFFLFAFLVPSFINERSYNTLSVFEKGAVEHILRAKGWLYGFEKVFWQVLYDFFVCCLFVVFLTA